MHQKRHSIDAKPFCITKFNLETISILVREFFD